MYRFRWWKKIRSKHRTLELEPQCSGQTIRRLACPRTLPSVQSGGSSTEPTWRRRTVAPPVDIADRLGTLWRPPRRHLGAVLATKTGAHSANANHDRDGYCKRPGRAPFGPCAACSPSHCLRSCPSRRSMETNDGTCTKCDCEHRHEFRQALGRGKQRLLKIEHIMTMIITDHEANYT